ncbi:MAG: RNA polymerase sigma factor [Gemmatimonadales bacterium]|nr:RNA polymerase sigma factor [Gemmatimonadales bacterium]
MTRHSNPDQTFVDLVDTYLDRVYRYLHNLTRDDDSARDLTHETFLRLHRQSKSGVEISEAYIFTTARNTALSNWRSNKREEAKRHAWGEENDSTSHQTGGIGPQPQYRNSPSNSVEQKDLGQALESALGCLSEDQRTVFLLSEVEGMKYENIADVLGISPGTVASRKFTAVRVLRDELERLGHALP